MTVVASVAEGEVVGCTVSAFAPVGIDPPLLLVCLDRRARTLSAVVASGRFSINILGTHQIALARRFSTAGVRDRFAGVAHRFEQDVPVLDEVVSFIVCDVYDAVPASDHTIVLGTPLVGAGNPGRRDPLVYVDRGWREIDPRGSGSARAG